MTTNNRLRDLFSTIGVDVVKDEKGFSMGYWEDEEDDYGDFIGINFIETHYIYKEDFINFIGMVVGRRDEIINSLK